MLENYNLNRFILFCRQCLVCVCLEKKSADNPLGLKNVPTYDPKREGSIGEQLSAGRAQGEGDVFEWRTTLSF